MQRQILLVGSLAFDIIFSLPTDFLASIPLENGQITKFNPTYIANAKTEHFGGTAGNIAYWLSEENLRATIFSAFGSDLALKGYQQKIATAGHRLTGPEGDYTANAYIVSDPLQQQLTIWQPNAYSLVDEAKLQDYLPKTELEQFDYAIFSAGSPQSIKRHLLEFRQVNNRATTIFDPGQVAQFFTASDFQSCLQASDILIGNDTEFSYFQKHNLTARLVLIETLGSSGAQIKTNGKISKISSFKPEKVVDTTGAGDAFRAGLLAGLSRGLAIEHAAELGSKLGASCVSILSGQRQV
jgi:adenosine kinase